MSYLVLARKWRPQRFDEVVGQRHVSLTLGNALKSDRLSHAYLFTGPRGVGKTSMARILAKALNCEQQPVVEPCNTCAACRAITEGHCLDVLEIDGASNRGIDDVRQLRESVKYAPSSVRAKVYIIDEVHMLTTDAFNALLKTLEEPPRHVYFVLATTEPLKVPATILSRCQRYDFGRLTVEELAGHLRRIVTSETLALDDEALTLLARKADGSVRDSLTLLDQIAATGDGPFHAAEVQALLGLAGSSLCFAISDAVTAGEGARALQSLQQAYREGMNLQELADELVPHFRNLMLLALDPKLEEVIDATREERARLVEQAQRARPADALRWLRILLEAATSMRRSAHGRVHLELALVEMAALPRSVDLAQVLERLRRERGARDDAAAGHAAGAAAGTAVGRQPAPGRAPRGDMGGADEAAPRASARDAGACAVAEEAPVAAVPLGTGEADALLSDWGLVLDRIRKERAFLGSCLHASRVLKVEDGRLCVWVDDANGFKCEQVEKPANRRFVLRVIEETYRQPLGLRLLNSATEPEPAPALAEPVAAGPAASAPPRPPRAARSGEDEGRARVSEIADLLDGDIIGPAY
jgi:DNA polymerase III subunit gamma/tau